MSAKCGFLQVLEQKEDLTIIQIGLCVWQYDIWSMWFMKVILLVLSLVRILYLLNPCWCQICVYSEQCTSVLVYKTSVQLYNCSKQSACTPSLDENTVAGSIWPVSKNVRKEGGIIFQFF